MAAFSSKLIFIVLILTGTLAKAEVPVSYPTQDNIVHTGIDAASSHNTAKYGIQWQILPGENIKQIAQLMFPKNSVARDNFIRAIIHTNPRHFPDGTYQPLPAGTIIHIPDLRTISIHAKPAAQTKKSNTTDNLSKTKSPESLPKAEISGLNDNHPALKLITQLEQIAETEAAELSTLLKRIASLEKQIAAMQSMLTLKMTAPSEIISTPLEADIPLPQNAITPSAEDAQPVAKTVTPPETNAPQLNHPTGPDETSNNTSIESTLSSDSVFLFGLLLTLLIIVLILRNHHKIKERFARSTDASLPNATERHRYEALLLRRSDSKLADSPESAPEAFGETISKARAFIEQDNPDAAIQLLQKQLATNQRDIPSWLLLFEQLYKSNNKSDFKKNARRFKRMGEFSDIWIQIQKLGNQLEPNEPLYFDELKRKEKFFSDASGSD
ncbi:FimV family protein [Nitrosomonas sp.]|uniref:type IV pilus assembly protein FimV n=1 Tax=Nitrosomonas sp. TaxID=42353 RepID=UPI00374D3BED